MEVRRGDIWFASLPEGVGNEQVGARPVLVVSNDKGNKESNIITVLVGTKHNKKYDLQTQFVVKAYHGLKFDTVFMAEQIIRIDKQRLQYYITNVNSYTMRDADKAMAIALGMYEPFNVKYVKALIDNINALDKELLLNANKNSTEKREEKLQELQEYCEQHKYDYKVFLDKYLIFKEVEMCG